MDNRYYENVIKEMQPFMDEQGFKPMDNGFCNDKKAFNVAYDEARQMYISSVADIAEDGAVGEFKELNSWLFDDSQNAKDAVSVGIDFTGTLRKELGIKSVRKVDNNIDLPSASKGDSMDINGFAKKMLDVFPSLKDDYKAHIAEYGNFLYLNFFGKHLVPEFKNLFENGTKKQIKKLYDVLDDAYVKGDRDTVNVVVAVLCAAAYNSEKATTAIREMLAEDTHFLSSFNTFIPVFAKNKKLLNALIK